jgi:hypothetical protein
VIEEETMAEDKTPAPTCNVCGRQHHGTEHTNTEPAPESVAPATLGSKRKGSK